MGPWRRFMDYLPGCVFQLRVIAAAALLLDPGPRMRLRRQLLRRGRPCGVDAMIHYFRPFLLKFFLFFFFLSPFKMAQLSNRIEIMVNAGPRDAFPKLVRRYRNFKTPLRCRQKRNFDVQ